MNQIPTKQRVPVGVEDRTSIPLQFNTLSTIDFGLVRPVHIMETISGDKLSISHSRFLRALPMKMPTLGQVDLLTQSFFVPFRLCWPLYQAIKDGRQSVRLGSTLYSNPKNPRLSNIDLVNLFLNHDDFASSSSTPGATGSDFWLMLSSDPDDVLYVSLKSRGRAALAILHSLGYSINWSLDDNTVMSAMPILALFRVYYDYIANPVRSDLSELEKFLNPLTGFDTTYYVFNHGIIYQMFTIIFNCFFDDDYFTAAWTGVDGIDINQNQNEFYVNPVTGDRVGNYESEEMVNSQISLASQMGNAGDVMFLSDHQFMDKVYKYIRRNNLVGTRMADQMLARYGIKPNWMDSLRSLRLDASRTPVEISDVMATASSDNGNEYSVVGDYAGKGIGYGGASKFSFEATEAGYIITIATVKPHAMYYQGRKRHVFHINREDFYTPEFDKLVGQVIRNDEIFSSYENSDGFDNGNMYGGKPDGVFGFCPRYTEYKVGYDTLAGDFRVPSLKGNMDALQLFREIAPPSVTHPLENNLAFSRLDFVDRRAYDRIFYVTSDSVDHFICQFHFNVQASRPVASITESQIPNDENGRTVTIDVGSPRM